MKTQLSIQERLKNLCVEKGMTGVRTVYGQEML